MTVISLAIDNLFMFFYYVFFFEFNTNIKLSGFFTGFFFDYTLLVISFLMINLVLILTNLLKKTNTNVSNRIKHFSINKTNMKMLNVVFFSVSNLYIDEYDVSPWNLAAYVQDKMEFQGMIVNLGLRMDYYNHGKDIYYPADFKDPVDITKLYGDPGYIKNPTKAQPFLYISPRLGISHPITENSVLHFSYGHFFQRPEYRFWFENMGYVAEVISVINSGRMGLAIGLRRTELRKPQCCNI